MEFTPGGDFFNINNTGGDINMCLLLLIFNGFPLSFAKSCLHQNLEMQHVFFKVLMQKGLSKAKWKSIENGSTAVSGSTVRTQISGSTVLNYIDKNTDPEP